MEQTELYPDRIGHPLVCVGAGGIASHAIPMFVRAGIKKLTLWDDDDVAPVNLQMQGFYATDVGSPKALVLARRAKQINPQIEVLPHTERFTRDKPLDPIVVSAVDLMQSREELFEAVVREREKVKFFIDGRFTPEGSFIDLYFIDPKVDETMEYYKKSLFSDEVASRGPRPQRMMAHVPLMLCGLIGESLARWVDGRSYPWKVTHDATALHTERYEIA